MNLDDLKEFITTTDSAIFCQEYLFDHSMWYFDSNHPDILPGITYEKFKSFIAQKVNVASHDIALGGSSKFGFSLNPDERQNKLFRPFNDTSDLDLVIVAPKLFSETWSALKNAFYNDYYWVMNTHSKHIFRGFIFLDDKRDYKTIYLRQTQKFMRSVSADLVAELGISRELKYRIYASWDDVHVYHASGIQTIKKALINDA